MEGPYEKLGGFESINGKGGVPKIINCQRQRVASETKGIEKGAKLDGEAKHCTHIK